MGKLLWAIQAWYAEMENSEKSEAIKAGQARARAEGKHMGRPRKIRRRHEVGRQARDQREDGPQDLHCPARGCQGRAKVWRINPVRNQDPKALPDPQITTAIVDGFGKPVSKPGPASQPDPGTVRPVDLTPDAKAMKLGERKRHELVTLPVKEPERALAKDATDHACQLNEARICCVPP
jgi:hypothetical protein